MGMGVRLAGVGQAYTRVIASPRYFPLWLAQLLSSFGDTLHYIALVVLVFQLTGHGLIVAGLVAAEVVPVLALGPIAGVIIDRFSRKTVLISADLFRATLVVTLLWPQGAWHAYVVAAGLAAGNTFFNPTVQAVIPVLTTEEQRLAANSVAWSTGRLVQILASAAAGGLIAAVGTAPAFGINAASFVASAALISTLRIPSHAGQLGAGSKRGLGSYFADARAGLGFARQDRFVSRLLLVQALASLATGATGAMLVVLSERHLQQPPAGFAWLIGAIGVGALLGPLIPNALAHDYRDARWLFVPYVIRGIGDVLVAIFNAAADRIGAALHLWPEHVGVHGRVQHHHPGRSAGCRARSSLHNTRRHLERDAAGLPCARRSGRRRVWSPTAVLDGRGTPRWCRRSGADAPRQL